MKLLPSLKNRNRYIAFEIIADRAFTTEEMDTTVMQAIKNFIGELGVAKALPIVIKEQTTGNRLVLKVNHKFVNEVKAALTLVNEINRSKVIIKSVTTSGILKKVST